VLVAWEGSAELTFLGSRQCGTCYSLTYAPLGKTIYVYAIDHTLNGFNIAQQAMDALTNGNAVQFGRVEADFAQVDISNCKVGGSGDPPPGPCKA
jgi:hypothetical protein